MSLFVTNQWRGFWVFNVIFKEFALTKSVPKLLGNLEAVRAGKKKWCLVINLGNIKIVVLETAQISLISDKRKKET